MATASSSRTEPRVPPATGGWSAPALWFVVLGACTLALWLVRDDAHEAHKALAYLLIVLGGSSRHGRVVGLLLAVASFLAFNFFLLEPYYTLAIEDPLDWGVLVAFLITSAVAAQLFHRTQRALAVAEDRATEVERLSALGAESLSVPRAVDAVAAIVRVIRTELPLDTVQVLILDEESGRPRVLAASPPEADDPATSESIREVLDDPDVVAVTEGRTAGGRARRGDLATVLESDPPARAALIPLRIRERGLGILRIANEAGLRLDRDQAFFADTLSYYAALAVERVRLTEEVQHVEALREADRLKDALLASVSHDLRTPLTTIRALAGELRGGGDERIAIIEEESERLNRLVTDLLDFSRIRSGALPLEPTVTAAEDLVGAMLQRLRGLPGSDRIEVFLPRDTLLLGRFDFVHSLRALSNLVENALRHAPPDGAVELRVTEEEGFLVFRILDRGVGIPEGASDKIFEPFYHTTGDQAGTGLGLPIARSVAEAQGGSVDYRPRSGGGSVFELRLPAERLDPRL